MHIVLTGAFRYGASDANALRVRNLARSLAADGHRLTVVESRVDPAVPEIEPVAPDEGVRLESVRESFDGLQQKLPRRLQSFLVGRAAAGFIRREARRPDCIILPSPHIGQIFRFRRVSRELGIPLIIDVHEWYQPEDLPGGRLGPVALGNELSMRRLIGLADGIIAISERLEQHYRDQGCRVINVPPLFPACAQPAEKWSAADGRLHLCYAGQPARKEAFGTTLACLEQAHREGIDFLLHVVGMTAAALTELSEAKSLTFLQPAAGRVRYHGFVPNAQARTIVAASDFTLLLRSRRKANQFGFPSKLAESMSLGTPVIANDFSDLHRHLVDGGNAIFIPDIEPATVLAAFRKAASMSVGDRRRLSRNSLDHGTAAFGIGQHAARLTAFLAAVTAACAQRR